MRINRRKPNSAEEIKMGHLACPICDNVLTIDETLVIRQETHKTYSVSHFIVADAEIPICYQSGFDRLSFDSPLWRGETDA